MTRRRAEPDSAPGGDEPYECRGPRNQYQLYSENGAFYTFFKSVPVQTAVCSENRVADKHNRIDRQLEEETSVKAVYINCWQYNTRPSLLIELLIQLGYPAPRKRNPVDELLSKIREQLDKNRSIAVAFDEFDQFEEDTEVVYALQLLNEESDNPIGAVMVSNQHPRQVQLDPRSQSRLNCETLQFKPYTATQPQEILEQRVEQAFRPSSVSEEVIGEIAERVAENIGDYRRPYLSYLEWDTRRTAMERRKCVWTLSDWIGNSSVKNFGYKVGVRNLGPCIYVR